MKSIFSIGIFLTFAFLTSCSDSDDDGSQILNDQSNNVGALSNGFLSAANYKTLVIEMAYEPGVRPTQAAVDSLENFLKARLNKNDISFIYKTIPDQNKSVYSLQEIRNITSNYRTANNSGNTITAFFFFANGGYDQDTDDSKTLGVAYNASSMAIFQKTIGDNTGGLTQPSAARVEEGVLKHEFCHILGLVNLGSPLQSAHEDAAHPKHCDENSCLMYYAVESNNFFDNLMGGTMPVLDSQCLADLRANGGK